MASILLIGVEPLLRAELQAPFAGGDIDIHVMSDAREALSWVEDNHSTLLVTLVGSGVDEPVRLAQRIHRLDSEIAVLILNDQERHPRVSRAIQYTPFLGDHVMSLPSEDRESVAESLQQAVVQGRQRRQFRSTLAAMNQQLETLSTHRVSAIQYLDHVLDNAPIGVVALDLDGHVISSNRRAGEILEQQERDLLGVALTDLFPEDATEQLQGCIERAAVSDASSLADVFERRTRTGNPQYVSATVAPLRQESDELGTLVLLQDVTAQVLTEQEREEALRLRDEFLSVAAHELKTPLTSIKGFSDLLGRQLQFGEWDQARISLLQQQLQMQVDRLELLVSDLLDVSRIRQGRLDLRVEPVNLMELARDVIERFQATATSGPQHQLVLDAPEDVTGTWDPDRLDQVLTNLVSNAIKYSPDGGEVRIAVHRREDEAEAAVSDEGLGMDQDLQAKLFQPFIRGDAGNDFPGTGLGLHITSQIVEQHGGSISVTSSPGEGSTFTVRLPIDSSGAGAG